MLWASCVVGCERGPAPEALRVSSRAASAGPVTLIAVGDTGEPGAGLRDVLQAIRAEPRKDAVLVLGDLIYPKGPACGDGALSAEALALLEERVGAPLSGLGAPAWLVLGNHDVAGPRPDPAREACYLRYVRDQPALRLPALTWREALGPATVIMINTNGLTEADGAQVAAWAREATGPVIIAGHHVWKTWHDKEDEDRVRPWMRRHGIKPDLYLNGHAHLLQAGIYDDVLAVTSGAGAKLREHPPCPGRCGEGQLWGQSRYGYAVVEVEAERLTVIFKDRQGAELWRTQRAVRATRSPRPEPLNPGDTP